MGCVGLMGCEWLFREVASENSAFDVGYFIHSSGVMLGGRVASVDEGADDLVGQFGADDASSEAQDVHIVMLDPLSSGVGVVAYSRADAWEFVRGYTNSDA